MVNFCKGSMSQLKRAKRWFWYLVGAKKNNERNAVADKGGAEPYELANSIRTQQQYIGQL